MQELNLVVATKFIKHLRAFFTFYGISYDFTQDVVSITNGQRIHRNIVDIENDIFPASMRR